MTGTGLAWGLASASLVLLVAGLVHRLWGFAEPGRGSSSAQGILAERLARGDITPEQYAERLRALGTPHRSRAPLRSLAIALGAVGLVGIVAVSIARWGSGHGWWDAMPHGPMMGNARTAGSAPAPRPGAPEVRVTGTEFAFSPPELRMEGNETVNLVFDNRGAAYHTLTIPDLDFELTADGDSRDEGALTARSPGTYEIVCAVPGHTEAGMRGRLVVEATPG